MPLKRATPEVVQGSGQAREREIRQGQLPTTPPVSTTRPAASFFPVTSNKLAVLSICTWGLYDYYWFYKNWSRIAERTPRTISPFWRTFFLPFWVRSCFREIREAGTSLRIPNPFDENWSALIYILFYFSSLFLPEFYWWVSIFSFIPLVVANRYASSINALQGPDYDRNDEFSVSNWIWIIVGAGLLVLALRVTFFGIPNG